MRNEIREADVDLLVFDATFIFFRNICRIMELNCCGQHFAFERLTEVVRDHRKTEGGLEGFLVIGKETSFSGLTGKLSTTS